MVMMVRIGRELPHMIAEKLDISRVVSDFLGVTISANMLINTDHMIGAGHH